VGRFYQPFFGVLALLMLLQAGVGAQDKAITEPGIATTKCWQKFVAITGLSPLLIDSGVLLSPSDASDTTSAHMLAVCSKGEAIIGTAEMSPDWSSLVAVILSDSQRGKPLGIKQPACVTADAAKNTATEFARSYTQDTAAAAKEAPKAMDRYGRYAVGVTYRKEGHEEVPMTVWVNWEGYVVGFRDGEAPPAEADVKPALPAVGAPLWAPDGKSLWWSDNHRWLRLPTWYPESTPSLATAKVTGVGQAIAVGQTLLSDPPPPREDGQTVVPDPFKVGKAAAYRPLLDFAPLSVAYTLPSISPDGRWLACATDGDVVTAVDLQANRIYCTAGRHRLKQRISWSTDSKQLAFADANTGAAYVLDLVGASEIPLDVPENALLPDGACAALTFLPGSSTELVAAYREWGLRADDGMWQIVRIHLADWGKPWVEPISERMPCPRRLWPTPDGKAVWLGTASGVQALDLATGKTTPVTWLADGAKVDDTATVDATQLDWDISPDGKWVAFTAKLTAGGTAIYTAPADNDKPAPQEPRQVGVDYRPPVCVSATNMTETLDRYFLQGKWATVPKSALRLGLLEKLHYIAPVDWPATP
jgi:hypothetical protein